VPAKSTPNSNPARGGSRPGAGRRKTADIVREALTDILAPKQAAFEAASRYSTNRHVIYTATQDPRKEFTESDRLELARKAWWLYNNSPVARRAVDALATLIVGPGLMPRPATSDHEWNVAALAHFKRTVGSTPFAFDTAAQLDFCSAQHFIIRHVALSGDLFAQYVLSTNGLAMCRFIPGEYIGNARDPGRNQDRWQDGVLADPATLRPQKYRVLTEPFSKKFTDVDADALKHIRAPHRLGYLRSPSWLTPAIDTMQDIAETTAFTKAAQKLAAQLGIVIESPEAGKIKLGSSITDSSATGESAQSGGGMTLDKLFPGVGHTQLKPGEKVTFLKNEHPSELFVPSMKFMREEAAYAFGLPPEMLFADSNLTGPGWRKILVESQAALERYRAWLKGAFLHDYYKMWAWHEMEAGRLPFIADWSLVEWSEPADQTIDFGRDMRAILDMQRNGSISPERAAELGGYDAHTEEDRIIAARIRREQKIRNNPEAQKLGLDFAAIFTPDKSPAPLPDPAAV